MSRLVKENPGVRSSSLGTTIATRSKGVSPRRRQKRQISKSSAHRCITIPFRSNDAYTCQLSLLIILNAQSYQTLRLVRQSDSQRIIEVERPKATHLHFDDLLYRIGGAEPSPLQPSELDTLEESLVAALRLLHAKNISFPISAKQIELLQPSPQKVPDGAAFPTLFFSYNKEASWVSDTLPPTWQDNQLFAAKAIFRTAKILLQLSDPSFSKPFRLDLQSQHILATYMSRGPASHHINRCLDVAPVTAELAYRIALALVLRNNAKESLEVLESFFGGSMPLPEPNASPDAIYASLRDLRARVCDSKGYGPTELTQDLSDELQLELPETAARLVCCRAQIATLRKELEASQWWLVAMNLYDTFLSSSQPSSILERICKFDLYRHRNKRFL
ncbi:hypothetical protein GGR54DRAFT_613255 [Hypoxylon sp. NC1633]|nr:hypothetical protein GGR54DRAFT_613255 [Hypoxylon sp. NC1633]